MDNRPTTEVVLPNSKIKVVLYNKLTYAQHRQLRRIALDAMKFKLDIETQKPDVEDISASFQMDAEDKALSFLVKSASSQEGQEIEPSQLVDLIDETDGDLLYAKINELTGSSSLSEEDKKK